MRVLDGILIVMAIIMFLAYVGFLIVGPWLLGAPLLVILVGWFVAVFCIIALIKIIYEMGI